MGTFPIVSYRIFEHSFGLNIGEMANSHRITIGQIYIYTHIYEGDGWKEFEEKNERKVVELMAITCRVRPFYTGVLYPFHQNVNY